jgi:hypothetical protein
MDRLGEQLGVAEESAPTAVDGCDLARLVFARGPVLRQFASKRLSSRIAILAKVTARTSAYSVALDDGPASLNAMTSPHRTAHPDMYDAGELEDVASRYRPQLVGWEKPEESMDPIDV